MKERKFEKLLSLVLSASLLITGLIFTGCKRTPGNDLETYSTPVPTRDDVTESISKTDTVKLANSLANSLPIIPEHFVLL
jgi:PBP1b-binding outer membrane lipoprotein LpoB